MASWLVGGGILILLFVIIYWALGADNTFADSEYDDGPGAED